MIWLACAFIFQGNVYTEQQYSNCVQLGYAAIEEGLDPPLILAIGYVESALRHDVTSPAGAKGIMQVLPKYWCKRKPCDYTKAGFKAWRTYRGQSRSVREALCKYNSGRACRKRPRSKYYANKVLKIYRKISLTYEYICIIPRSCAGREVAL